MGIATLWVVPSIQDLGIFLFSGTFFSPMKTIKTKPTIFFPPAMP